MRSVFILLLGLVAFAAALPAETRIREQLDKEHEEGVDRINVKLRDNQAGEVGNKDRQTLAQNMEVEKRRYGGGRRKDSNEDAGPPAPSPRRSSAMADEDRMPSKMRAEPKDSGERDGRRGLDAFDRKKEAKLYDRQHEDVARYQGKTDIDLIKDSFRTKDKSSHKKEELYLTR